MKWQVKEFLDWMKECLGMLGMFLLWVVGGSLLMAPVYVVLKLLGLAS